jgi:hypothetical protein
LTSGCGETTAARKGEPNKKDDRPDSPQPRAGAVRTVRPERNDTPPPKNSTQPITAQPIDQRQTVRQAFEDIGKLINKTSKTASDAVNDQVQSAFLGKSKEVVIDTPKETTQDAPKKKVPGFGEQSSD